MSKSLLDQIYNGDLFPFENLNVIKMKHEKLSNKANEDREHFKSILSDEEWSKFMKMEDETTNSSSVYGYENFTYGFRLGAKTVLESMYEKETDF